MLNTKTRRSSMKTIKTNVKEGIILGWTKDKKPTMETITSINKALSFDEAVTIMSYALNAYMQGYSTKEDPKTQEVMFEVMSKHFNKILSAYSPELFNKQDPTLEAYRLLGRRHEDEFIKILSEVQEKGTSGSTSS